MIIEREETRSPLRTALLATAILFTLMAPRRRAFAQDTFTTLAKLPASTDTCCKPQSKLWLHDDRWWAVMPSTSVSPSGTWLWRLEPNHTWKNVLRLSSATGTRADARAVGDVTHILLHGSSPQLVSIEYDASQTNYVPWSVRPTITSIPLPGSETATIDVDTEDRLWLSTESGSNVLVRWSDPPYSSFSNPITLANNIAADDITSVIAMPVPAPPKVGVYWSNQNTERLGFRTHRDGDPPTAWTADEMPASQSALHVGGGMADDHMNLKLGADGTLYVAAKTSYNDPSFPLMALLVRRPNGVWDDLYEVDDIGTRPLMLLNDADDLLRFVYPADSGGGTLLYRDSLMSAIGFGSRHTLINAIVNNPTSTKDNWFDQVVVLAGGNGVLITRPATGTTATTTTASTSTSTSSTTSTSAPRATTTSTIAATTTTTAPTPATTTTTLPAGSGGVNTYQAGVSGPAGSASVDTNIRLDTATKNLGSDVDLYVGVTNGPTKVFRTLLAFDIGTVPPGATITSCTLTVNVTQRTNPTAGHVRRLCGEHWLDGDGQGELQATWNQWKSGSSWTAAGAGGATADCAAGGDYTTAGEIAFAPPAGNGLFTFPNLAALCQDARANRAGWLRLRLSQDAEGTQSHLFKFDSSDGTTVANRPKLSVTWSLP